MIDIQRTYDFSVTRQTEAGPHQIPLVVHQSKQQGVIVINYPGWNADYNGYQDKYRTLANFIAGKCEIGTVVRMGNFDNPRLDYANSVIEDLISVINACKREALGLSGVRTPLFYLMGYSAGAGAVAAVAGEIEGIKKILLIAPAGDANNSRFIASMSKYTGEVYSVVGANDQKVGSRAAQDFASLAPNALVNQTYVVPDCDHQFQGEVNGKILSSLPLWAFSNSISEPSAEHGIKLYS